MNAQGYLIDTNIVIGLFCNDKDVNDTFRSTPQLLVLQATFAENKNEKAEN